VKSPTTELSQLAADYMALHNVNMGETHRFYPQKPSPGNTSNSNRQEKG
jgi:hypothetical protein